MKNCDENLKLDDSLLLIKKCPYAEEDFCTAGSFQISFF